MTWIRSGSVSYTHLDVYKRQGQAFHFLSPLVPFIYLLMDLTEISLAEYQGYIFKWCIGIFVIFMGAGLLLGYLPVL